MKAVFPPGAITLGHAARPGEFGFLAAAESHARRSVLLLPHALVAFDLPLCEGKPEWRPDPAAAAYTVKLDCGALLHVVAPEPPLESMESLDLAGVRLPGYAVLFRIEATMARDAVSYVVEGGGTLRHLVTGLAPGSWQVWWNGWLEDPGLPVEPREGLLSFEGPAGSYFLRHF